jgi:hypothetical protein
MNRARPALAEKDRIRPVFFFVEGVDNSTVTLTAV